MPNLSDFTDCITTGELTEGQWQLRARAEFEYLSGETLDPWVWVLPACGNARCVNPQHLIAEVVKKIRYPEGVCVYCGMPAGTEDHLLPRNWTGSARRHSVAVVPACGECNNRINDAPTASVTERRELAHNSLRRSKKAVLEGRPWTPEDLDELGPGLRSTVEARQAERRVLEARLAWPDDPAYDLRAFQKTGIPDPYAVGMLGTPYEGRTRQPRANHGWFS